jgi:hypothetical protein
MIYLKELIDSAKARKDAGWRTLDGVPISTMMLILEDAIRYRWLRTNDYDTGSYHAAHEFNNSAWFEHLDDAAIDAAIADEA